jgi:glycerophosphoryl diester phosphodiesterase
MKRVGHKGADLVAPGNTPASFEAALEHGVDMIEFDILRTRGGHLVLAHDYEDAAKRTPLTLDEGLDLFAGEAYAGVELDVDMKHPGFEKEVVSGLAARGLRERSLVSSQHLNSLDRIGELEPHLRRGLSVPRARRDYTRSPLAPIIYVILRYMRARMPNRASKLLREGRIQAVMSHRLLVSRRLVAAVADAGGELFVWTVDDRSEIERLEALGVHGVITNDPRLFATSAP